MNGNHSLLADLLADCDAQGIRLSLGSGGLIIDAPQMALTPELLRRLKVHKADLLALLRLSTIDLSDAPSVWHAGLDRLEGDPLFPPDLMQALRASKLRWIVP